jgi:Excalibur calcium-binding domain
MTENSTAGLTMLDADRSVVVAGQEHHQDVLWEYLPVPGHSRRVAIELVPIGPRLEARLDGQRVGELTALMSLRYGPTVDSVLRSGERPGCAGRVVWGKGGAVEVELRLPAVNAAGGPPTEQLPVIVSTRPRKRSRTPLWVAVAIVGLLVVIGGALGLARGVTPPAAAVAVPTPVAAPPSTVVERPPVRPSRAAPATTTSKPSAVYYKNCGVALAEGAAPILRGDPGYRSGLDPDGDGVACPV